MMGWGGKHKSAPRVCVIGGGLGGLGMAVNLKRAGIDDFTVFEKSDGPGGVWWDNRYPGCAVDVPSQYYQFSYRQIAKWTRTCARSGELRDYVQATIDEFGLEPHFRFGTAVHSCEWEEWHQKWHVELDDEETESYDIVVSAVGLLNIPNYPKLPGMGEFEGPMFHTARWEDEHDLKGKRVAYIGTGSTAAQAVPALAKEVDQLYVFQREPGWVIPKEDVELTPQDGPLPLRVRLRMRKERLKLFLMFEQLSKTMQVGSPTSRQFEAMSMDYLRQTIKDPELVKKLTPTHPMSCKRPVLSSEFYPALNEPNVELVASAVEGFGKNSVRTANGEEREVDAVILSTGFKAVNYLSTLKVAGRGGKDLHEAWQERGGPNGYLGVSVPRFPNFFMIYGPNTNAPISIIFIEECQVNLIMSQIKRMMRRGWSSLEVRPTVNEAYRRWVDTAAADHPAAIGGCNHYFGTAEGKIVTLWPSTAKRYWALCRLSRRGAFKGRPGAPWGGQPPASGSESDEIALAPAGAKAVTAARA